MAETVRGNGERAAGDGKKGNASGGGSIKRKE
jgi:hypothetical protein